jgi:hypothetical protein
MHRNRRVNETQRDLSVYEDAELSCEGYERIDALVKHLLVGTTERHVPLVTDQS